MMMLIDPYRFRGSGPIACEYLGYSEGSGTGTSTTWTTSCPAGDVAVGRHVFAVVYWVALVPAALSSATIGGVPAVIHAQISYSAGFVGQAGMALIAAKMEFGNPVDIETTFDASIGRPGIYTYRVTNLVSNVAIATDIQGGSLAPASQLTAHCNVQSGGLAIMFMSAEYSDLTVELTGTSQEYEDEIRTSNFLVSGGYYLPTADENPRTFISDLHADSVRNHAMIAASFR